MSCIFVQLNLYSTFYFAISKIILKQNYNWMILQGQHFLNMVNTVTFTKV